jgi:hypothetical protein
MAGKGYFKSKETRGGCRAAEAAKGDEELLWLDSIVGASKGLPASIPHPRNRRHPFPSQPSHRVNLVLAFGRLICY